ncbi:unnamed protein product [Didymodactylos carnosus]|uniref:Nudix hydrolase domain-containing protein n=2 Tax=Didymodactylos carnosus TaxID=1234261 RepID=A0A814W078_9BILA|nr:unnamed protein product [Didymodactylos carnosus]CAF3960152.1 unnamed protein product [Didymodactylos carnosus]
MLELGTIQPLLYLLGEENAFELYLQIETWKNNYFDDKDHGIISKKIKMIDYILHNQLFEKKYPTIQRLDKQVKIQLIRGIVHLFNSKVQPEAYGIILINSQDKVFLVQNDKLYWSFPKGKPKIFRKFDSVTNKIYYEYEEKWNCATREFFEETKVDLTSYKPTDYWIARLNDGRKIGLFVIDRFCQNAEFQSDKREILNTIWLDIRNQQREMEALKMITKEGRALKHIYVSAIPFLRHLLVNYLPARELERHRSEYPCHRSSTPNLHSKHRSCVLRELLPNLSAPTTSPMSVNSVVEIPVSVEKSETSITSLNSVVEIPVSVEKSETTITSLNSVVEIPVSADKSETSITSSPLNSTIFQKLFGFSVVTDAPVLKIDWNLMIKELTDAGLYLPRKKSPSKADAHLSPLSQEEEIYVQ